MEGELHVPAEVCEKLRQVLTARKEERKKGVKVMQFERFYHKQTGEKLALAALGCPSLLHFLQAVKHIARLEYDKDDEVQRVCLVEDDPPTTVSTPDTAEGATSDSGGQSGCGVTTSGTRVQYRGSHRHSGETGSSPALVTRPPVAKSVLGTGRNVRCENSSSLSAKSHESSRCEMVGSPSEESRGACVRPAPVTLDCERKGRAPEGATGSNITVEELNHLKKWEHQMAPNSDGFYVLEMPVQMLGNLEYKDVYSIFSSYCRDGSAVQVDVDSRPVRVYFRSVTSAAKAMLDLHDVYELRVATCCWRPLPDVHKGAKLVASLHSSSKPKAHTKAYTLFLGNLPKQIPKKEIVEYFHKYHFTDYRFYTKEDCSYDFGFMAFPSTEAAQQAIFDMNSVVLGGHTVIVDWSKETEKQIIQAKLKDNPDTDAEVDDLAQIRLKTRPCGARLKGRQPPAPGKPLIRQPNNPRPVCPNDPEMRHRAQAGREILPHVGRGTVARTESPQNVQQYKMTKPKATGRNIHGDETEADVVSQALVNDRQGRNTTTKCGFQRPEAILHVKEPKLRISSPVVSGSEGMDLSTGHSHVIRGDHVTCGDHVISASSPSGSSIDEELQGIEAQRKALNEREAELLQQKIAELEDLLPVKNKHSEKGENVQQNAGADSERQAGFGQSANVSQAEQTSFGSWVQRENEDPVPTGDCHKDAGVAKDKHLAGASASCVDDLNEEFDGCQVWTPPSSPRSSSFDPEAESSSDEEMISTKVYDRFVQKMCPEDHISDRNSTESAGPSQMEDIPDEMPSLEPISYTGSLHDNRPSLEPISYTGSLRDNRPSLEPISYTGSLRDNRPSLEPISYTGSLHDNRLSPEPDTYTGSLHGGMPCPEAMPSLEVRVPPDHLTNGPVEFGIHLGNRHIFRPIAEKTRSEKAADLIDFNENSPASSLKDMVDPPGKHRTLDELAALFQQAEQEETLISGSFLPGYPAHKSTQYLEEMETESAPKSGSDEGLVSSGRNNSKQYVELAKLHPLLACSGSLNRKVVLKAALPVCAHAHGEACQTVGSKQAHPVQTQVSCEASQNGEEEACLETFVPPHLLTPATYLAAPSCKQRDPAHCLVPQAAVSSCGFELEEDTHTSQSVWVEFDPMRVPKEVRISHQMLESCFPTFKPREFQPGSIVNLVITHTLKEGYFFAQCINKKEEMDALGKMMAELIEKAPEGSVDHMDQRCAVLEEESAIWCRGWVTDTEPTRLKVLFVDYGWWDWILSHHVRALPAVYWELSPQAFPVHYMGVDLEDLMSAPSDGFQRVQAVVMAQEGHVVHVDRVHVTDDQDEPQA